MLVILGLAAGVLALAFTLGPIQGAIRPFAPGRWGLGGFRWCLPGDPAGWWRPA
ncbi:MAG: hypothetical protein CM1200mP2_30790 [Planctomycetaceae bacterium]|nr:MAG: hypothetical protein CM1200mP2_30790 [Planctomycetaceae bacterium]